MDKQKITKQIEEIINQLNIINENIPNTITIYENKNDPQAIIIKVWNNPIKTPSIYNKLVVCLDNYYRHGVLQDYFVSCKGTQENKTLIIEYLIFVRMMI